MKFSTSHTLRLCLWLLYFDHWKSAWAMAPHASAPATTSTSRDRISQRDGGSIGGARIVKKKRRRKSKRQQLDSHGTNPQGVVDHEPLYEGNQRGKRSGKRRRRRKSPSDFASSNNSTKSYMTKNPSEATEKYPKPKSLEYTTRPALEESKNQVKPIPSHVKEVGALSEIDIPKNDDSAKALQSNSTTKSPSKRRRKRKKMNAVSETPKDVHSTIDNENVLIPLVEDEVEDFVDGNDSTNETSSKRVNYQEPPLDNSIESGVVHESQSSSLRDSESSPALSISRNETSESFTMHDESHPDEPIKWESTKYRQEETVHDTIRIDDTANDSASTAEFANASKLHTMKTTVKSSEEREIINMSGKNGNASQAFIMNISRTRKEQNVHIQRRTATELNDSTTTTKKKTSSSQKPIKAMKSTTSSASRSGKGGECLRRIKREWKDAVRMGIAYDWISMRTLRSSSSSSTGASAGAGGNSHAYVRIGPFGKNLLRWHFSVQGPANSVYEEGVYHGRVLLPKDYPGSPPRVQMLTPSGRFIPGEDICLSASNYHPETWTPQWTILSLVDALRIHMLTMANEIGGVMASDDKRRQLATESRSWSYPGVVDHRRMIESGIFPWSNGENVSIHADNIQLQSGDKNAADLGDADLPLTKKLRKNTIVGPTQQRSKECENLSSGQNIDEQEKSMDQKDVKISKSSKQQKKERGVGVNQTQTKLSNPIRDSKQSKSSDRNRNKSSATGSKKSRIGSAEMQTEMQPNDLSNPKTVLSSLTKYLIVEMIKLPLRVLSILLRVLTILESRLRSLLDSL